MAVKKKIKKIVQPTASVDVLQEPPKQEKVQQPFAVVFELEYVAAQGRALMRDALAEVLKDHNATLTPAVFARYALAAAPEAYMVKMTDELGVKRMDTDKLIAKAKNAIAEKLISASAAVPKGLLQLFEHAVKNNYRLVALTMLPENKAAALVEKLGLSKFNIQVFTGERLEKGFPRADVWMQVVRKLETRPRRCLALVSSGVGCKTSISADLRCVAFPDEFTAFQDYSGADFVMESFDDIRPQEVFMAFREMRM